MARRKTVIRCGCKRCTWGSHTRYGGFMVQCVIKRIRHKTAQYLKTEQYDKAMDVIESAGYLD